MNCLNFTDRIVLSEEVLTSSGVFPKLLVTLLFLLYAAYEYVAYVRRYPRGPFPWPVLGNLLQINAAYVHRSLVKWTKKYGNVYTIWMSKPVVVIADLKTLRTALVEQNENFSGRPMSFLYQVFNHHQPDGDGIILAQGAKHTTQRRFVLKTFRNLGMGKRDMERRINFHKDQLLERLGEEIRKDPTGKSVVIDPHHQIAFCFANIMQELVMGRVYQYNDEEFLQFKACLDVLLENIHSPQLLLVDSFPWLRFVLPAYRRFERAGFALQKFFFEEIDRHQRQLDLESEPTNLIDAYLHAMRDRCDDMQSRLTLVLDAGEMWTAGLETVVNSVRWAIVYFIRYPEVQKKLQDEIDAVLNDRAATYGDRLSMPYLRATIDELQRIINVLPWHIPHATPEDGGDVYLEEHRIPPGTKIFPAFGAVHFDEAIFPNTETFRPERFITTDGKYDTEFASKHLNPFGLGKRECLGKSLAQMELALVLTSLIQNFHFEAEAAGEIPSLDRLPRATSSPKSYRCRIVQRRKELVRSASSLV